MKNKTSLVALLQLFCVGLALAQEAAREVPLMRLDPSIMAPPSFERGFNPGASQVPPLSGGSKNVFGNIKRVEDYGYKVKKPSSVYTFPYSSRFQSYDVNNIGNLNCIIKNDEMLNGLDDVQDITDVNVCFAGKRSWKRPRGDEKLSERQLLEKDNEVCKCLRSKKKFTSLQAILNTETPNLPNFSTTNAFGNFKRNLHIVKDKITSRHEMISLQASLIFNGNVKFASEYSEGLSSVNGAELQIDPKKMNLNESQAAEIRAGDRAELSSKIVTELQKFKAEQHQPNMNLYSEKKFASSQKQCISFREFISYKTLPLFKESKDVFDKPFVASEWDYKVLRHNYKRAMAYSPENKKRSKEKILEMKAKILFLDSNPMIKNVIAATQNLPNYLVDSSIPKEIREAVKAKFSGPKLAEIQNNLFSIMKNFNKEKDDAGAYRKNLGNFYANDEIKHLNEIMTLIEDKRDQAPLESEEALLPPEMFKPENLTQKALEEEFIRATGLSSPDNCTEGGVDIIKCAETYAGYCRTIDTAVDTIRQMDDEPSVANDLDSQLKDLLNPDIATNKTFREFNESVCDTPRKKRGGGQELSFFEFKNQYCFQNPRTAECSLSSPGDYEKIRNIFNVEYPKHVSKLSGILSNDDIDHFNETINKAPVTVIASEEAKALFTPGKKQSFATMQSGGNTAAFEAPTGAKAVPLAGVARSLGGLANAMGGSSDSSVGDESQVNYSTNNLNIPQTSQTAEVPKIENMPQSEREELLEDWKKDLADWKADKKLPDSSQSVASASEASMKAKIEALEQLLAQQKKLTEDQYKLLNDSLAAKTSSAAAERSIASVEEDESPKSRKKSGNGIVGSNVDLNDETQRGPGNIPDSQLNTSGSAGGSSAQASSRARSSGASAASDSRESVAREEAKLVNLRENSNGSITITSSNNGAVASSANAIVVPVSDALYLSAQSNPNGLNLSQIQQSIPADQIARLQDKGDFFILLLQNGSNPPLEVKVKKENNQLVQVEGAPIVSRRVSLDSLRNTLK